MERSYNSVETAKSMKGRWKCQGCGGGTYDSAGPGLDPSPFGTLRVSQIKGDDTVIAVSLGVAPLASKIEPISSRASSKLVAKAFGSSVDGNSVGHAGVFLHQRLG